MLFPTTKDSIKKAFEYVAKLPFSKPLLHKLSEKARGHSIVYFSLHRVIEDSHENLLHPHRQNRTALTKKQAHKLLLYINHRLPFISLSESLDYLKGNQKLSRSHAVLLIEVPYLQTVRQLNPLLEEMCIPVTYILDSHGIESGQMPWMDEITFRLGTTSQEEIHVTFIDRIFSLATPNARALAALHLIENLSHATPATLLLRMNELRNALTETAIPPVGERICTLPQLEKVSMNPLFTFASAGQIRLPFFDITKDYAEKEIALSKQELSSMFHRAFVPVFFYPTRADKKHTKEIIRLLIENGYHASITRDFGVCRPGDNLFRLLRLPLAYGVRSFEQFELQGLLDAIDEFLLITFGEEREL